MDVEKAIAKQLANIEIRTGKKLDELVELVKKSGVTKHGEVVAMLKSKLGMGHGDANAMAHYAKTDGNKPESTVLPDEAIDALYTGAKINLRPIHDALMKKISDFGEFEIAPKKGYLSLRRAKQFACVTPATQTRLDVGIILKSVEPNDRLIAQPEKAMFPFKVGLHSAKEVDRELVSWLRKAFEAAS